MTNSDIDVTLVPEKNCFTVRIGTQSIDMHPREFEILLEKSLSAAATHINAHMIETGKTHDQLEKKNEPLEVLVSTGMAADIDSQSEQVLTRMEIGPIALHFATSTEKVIQYCRQVMLLLKAAPPDKPNKMAS